MKSDSQQHSGVSLPASDGSVFGGVFSKIQMMTPAEQRLVDVGECPACRPQEGRADKMRLLLRCEAITGYQCNRCKNVWVTNTPNTQLSELAENEER